MRTLGSRFKVQGSRFNAQSSKFKVQKKKPGIATRQRVCCVEKRPLAFMGAKIAKKCYFCISKCFYRWKIL